MPLHSTLSLAAGPWTPITSGAIGGPVRVQNQGPNMVMVQATAGGAPSNDDAGASGSLEIAGFQGDVIELATRFPGVAGASALWARSLGPTDLSVSHG